MAGLEKLGLVLWLAAGLLVAAAGVPSAAETPPIAQMPIAQMPIAQMPIAQMPIAQIKKVTGQAAVLRSGERRPAVVGDMLFVKDVIETGSDGAVGITFIDNTVFSAGLNSQLALDEFRFDSNNLQGSMLIEMRQGTLRGVSGDVTRSSPEAMKIKTPVAVLGVRGTTFAVEVYGNR